MMIEPRPLGATITARSVDLTTLASRMPEFASEGRVPSRPRRDDHQRSLSTANPWPAKFGNRCIDPVWLRVAPVSPGLRTPSLGSPRRTRSLGAPRDDVGRLGGGGFRPR